MKWNNARLSNTYLDYINYTSLPAALQERIVHSGKDACDDILHEWSTFMLPASHPSSLINQSYFRCHPSALSSHILKRLFASSLSTPSILISLCTLTHLTVGTGGQGQKPQECIKLGHFKFRVAWTHQTIRLVLRSNILFCHNVLFSL